MKVFRTLSRISRALITSLGGLLVQLCKNPCCRLNSFLAAILDELVSRTQTFEAENSNNLDILHATGPDAVTSVYYRHRQKCQDVKMPKSEIMGLGSYGVRLVHGS